MQEPLPTPYDIIAPPGIPYSPSLPVWFLLVTVAVVLFLLLTLALKRLKRTERKPVGSPGEQVQNLLERCKQHPDSREQVGALVRAVRRYVSFTENADITALAAFELRAFYAARSNDQLQQLIDRLIEVEQLRYRSTGSSDQLSLSQLQSAFLEYRSYKEGA